MRGYDPDPEVCDTTKLNQETTARFIPILLPIHAIRDKKIPLLPEWDPCTEKTKTEKTMLETTDHYFWPVCGGTGFIKAERET